MLSCNELSLNYAIVLYDKVHSKIEIVQDIIQELPSPPLIFSAIAGTHQTS